MKTTGYQETQQFFALGVPLMLQYHTTDPGVQWYFNAGGKVFVPFNTSIQVSADKVVFSGYYPDFNINVANLPQHGFGTVNGWKADASTSLKPSAALSAATGASFSLSPDLRLYAGVYVDYGLTDMKGKNDTLPLVSYSPGGVAGVKAGSVINGAGAGKANLLAFGVQLRLSFGGSRPKPAARSRTKEAAQPVTTDTISTDQYDLIVRPVIFGLIGETQLPDIQQKHLDEVADVLKLFPNIRISVVGHFCNSETEVEDRRVGQERARAVAQYLQSKGIGAGRMKVSWANEGDEMVPYNPIANYRSRKVVITVD
jgi:outer membrane protein OmpA-like peptidoglycan-associated protein